MIKLTRSQEGMDESYGLRVAVAGGGCSGFQYALDFEQEARDTDESFEVDGLQGLRRSGERALSRGGASSTTSSA